MEFITGLFLILSHTLLAYLYGEGFFPRLPRPRWKILTLIIETLFVGVFPALTLVSALFAANFPPYSNLYIAVIMQYSLLIVMPAYFVWRLLTIVSKGRWQVFFKILPVALILGSVLFYSLMAYETYLSQKESDEYSRVSEVANRAVEEGKVEICETLEREEQARCVGEFVRFYNGEVDCRRYPVDYKPGQIYDLAAECWKKYPRTKEHRTLCESIVKSGFEFFQQARCGNHYQDLDKLFWQRRAK